jgi:NADH dehydrogenase FAD-containing subunit
MPKVVIVGSGFYGISTANRLINSGAKDVTLISPSDYGYIIPASIRVAVYNETEGTFFPLSEILNKQVKIIKGKADFFDEEKVTVNSKHIKFDILVLATGSKWNDPISSTADLGDDYKTYFQEQHDKLESAKHIVLIGGGFINCEFAGELLDKYGKELANGDKTITLIHSDSQLLTSQGFYGDGLRSSVTKFFEESFVDLKLSTRATISSTDQHEITLSNGEKMTADHIIISIGSQPCVPSHSIPNLTNSNEFIDVDDTFQAKAVRKGNIFAIGDVNSFKFKGLIARDRWVNAIVKNIISVSKGNSKKLIKIPQQQGHVPCVVSLGRYSARGQFPTFFGTVPLPQWLCVWAKASSLFRDKPKSQIFTL